MPKTLKDTIPAIVFAILSRHSGEIDIIFPELAQRLTALATYKCTKATVL